MHKTTKSTAVKEAVVSGQLIENVNNGLTLTHADARLHSKLKHIKALEVSERSNLIAPF